VAEIAVQTDGGTAATHEELTILRLRVAPAVGDERNRVLTGVIPIASWRVEDLRFEFGMSFVRPEISEEIGYLKALREANKVQVATPGGARPSATLFPPLSIFGHADPVGGDDFNKVLSGRRAVAIYALLTRQTNLWEDLHAHPLGNDDWGKCAVRTMLARLGFPGTDPASALQSYQNARGMPASGQADVETRKKLYAEYMDAICGVDFVLDTEDDFLARGRDHLGKGDYQGCSDFNLVRIFSQREKEQFDRPESHPQRNIANARNRRVVALLFQPGTYIDPQKWPCPRASEGVSGCRKRFWSDSEIRRGNQSGRREYKDTRDTFGCRFYDRISSDSPCERRDSLVEKVFQLQIQDYECNPLANCPYSLKLQGKQINDSTDGSGFTAFRACVDGTGELRVKDQVYKLTFADSLPEDVVHTQALLNALGFNAGPLDGRLGRRTEDALKSFQRTHELEPTGKIDGPTFSALRQEQIIRDLDDTGEDSTDSPSAGPSGSPQPRARVKSTPGVAHGIFSFSVPTDDDDSVSGAPPPPPAPAPAPMPSPPPTPTVIKTVTTSVVALPPPHNEFSEAIIRRFADMDLDKDGFLSKDEINVALGKASFKGVDGAMVATLKKILGDHAQLSHEKRIDSDGITQADVTDYDRNRETYRNLKVYKNIWNLYSFAKDKIDHTAAALFVGDPDFLQVKQGFIGDCWFLAALVAVGMRDKADVVKMVKPIAGAAGYFDVTFPGAGKTITVEKPTDGEIAILSSVGANGFWLSTLEKAYGTAINQAAYYFVDATVTDTINAGNTLGKGIHVMTGRDSTGNTISLTRNSVLRKQLTDAFANKKIVTAGIRPSAHELIDKLPGDNFRDDGLPMGHAYTVLSFDSAKDTIKLRNPWGNTGPKGVTEDHGSFEMNMTDFFSDFSDLASEDSPMSAIDIAKAILIPFPF
jgi:hypothetical protein